MASKKGQRIGIWIIAVAMVIGTLGSFVIMVLANDNQAKDDVTQQADYAQQLKVYQDSQKLQAQTNADNSIAQEGYSAAPFDAVVTALKKEILVAGTGDEVSATDSISVSYVGWTSDGAIFDSSRKKDTNTDTPVTLSLTGVIQGWTNGLTGQRVGSTIKLTIPSSQAYGATGSGTIPADAPLQFIVTIHAIEAAS
jgi:FKBP-type peptidyl-prolyl cis-trans isomerase